MKKKIIGKDNVKELLFSSCREKPEVSMSSIDKLNDYLIKTLISILIKANEIRKIRGENKRLTSFEIEKAISELNKKEE